MTNRSYTRRDGAVRQLEGALLLLSDCPDGQVPSVLLETALFLVGSATAAEADGDRTLDALIRIEETVAAFVTRAKAREPNLPDIGRAAEDYAAQRQKTEETRRQTELLNRRRETLERELSAYSSEQREQTEKIAVMERQLELLRENLNACHDAREELTAWFHAVSSPIEAMSGILDEPDFTTLRRTLDPAALSRYRTLHDEIEQRILAMNELLTLCAEAVRRDQRSLETKVERKEETP